MRATLVISTSTNLASCARNMMAHGRIFGISDLHVDYTENLEFVNGWSDVDYQGDALIVAGDVSDKITLLEATLKSFQTKFKTVFYVPGNHELWIRSKEISTDSVTKFHKILTMCDKIGVHYKPQKVQLVSGLIWIVPLFSWYAKPEDDPEDSLYRKPPPHITENVEFGESIWMDNHLCKWTKLHFGQTVSGYFADLNHEHLKTYDAPVVSFSHFLPRWELIPGIESDMERVTAERKELGLGEPPQLQGGVKGFNFARYAGSKVIESQIRRIGSVVHLYGHQHRNRDRVIDGVRYVSHCLGNPREQKEGWVWGVRHWNGPKLIWPPPE